MPGKPKKKPETFNYKFYRLPFGFIGNRASEAHHLLRWRSANKHGLLICVKCGFSWLKIVIAKISLDGEVECRDETDCLRRRIMRMRIAGEN